MQRFQPQKTLEKMVTERYASARVTDTAQVPVAKETGTADFSRMRARLAPAERAFAKALIALRDKNYAEASKQLSAFRGLEPQAVAEEVQVLQEALTLLLAIHDEIRLLEGSAAAR